MTTSATLISWGVLLCVTLPFAAFPQTTPAELANNISYSVPISPAFELLPNKPSEVSNMVTPKDILATVPTFVSNGKVKTGIAADIRPLSYLVKASLTEYQNKKKWWKRALWRTVLAVGTAPDPTNNNDAFLSTGLRISLVDNGDPRANAAYTDSLTNAYVRGLGDLPQPGFGLSIEETRKRNAQARAEAHRKGMISADSVRKLFNKDSWNKFRLDVGGAFMARAQNSSYRSDSLKGDRWGIWLATGLPLGENAQLNATAKATHIIRPSAEKSETSRYVVGGRFRIFLNGSIAFSVEGAQIWSYYGKSSDLTENWIHLAAIAEINIPQLGGWLTLGYGGDTFHRTATDSKFSFSYAVATNRIFKK